MIVATLLGGQLLFGNFQAYCTISTNCSQGVTCDACEHSDGVHEPNFGHDRHQNCSFVSKIGQNGPKFHKNRPRQGSWQLVTHDETPEVFNSKLFVTRDRTLG